MAGFPQATWIVGAGNMAGAMLAGWRSVGVDLSPVTAIRPSGAPIPGVRVQSSLPDGPAPAMAILGFKPQILDEVAPQLGPKLNEGTLLVSLLAGTPIAALRERFPQVRSIVRAMPNLPVAVRRGVTALYTEDADEASGQLLNELMTMLGTVVWSPNPAHFGAVGAMAASGPAYVARFIEALAGAGAARGIDPGLAATLALETVLGTGWLGATEREPMESIVRRVASPKGTTLAGLAVLEPALSPLLGRTIDAAIARGEEIASQARQA